MNNYSLNKSFRSNYGEVKYGISGEGPPLILVHGTPWSSFNWRHIIPGLSQWFTVYYYDLPGYGLSEKGENVSLGIQNQVLHELLTHWKMENPVMIGHDFGGTTVLRTHLLNNWPFKKMILIDPVAVGPWGSPFFSHVNEYEKAFRGIPSYIHDSIVSAYVQSAMFKEMNAETLSGIKAPWSGKEGQAAFYRQIAQADQTFTDEIEESYPHIQVPALLIWGEEDTWIPIEKGRQLHQAIPDSLFISVPEAGHLVQEDQPATLLAHLLRFASS
ncbi:alpha/beta fold hydrolase [Alkalicoccus halolimnae]|uniref:Alpha/beta hydrolase n=1 Tax=Alkalicoccus halolimnae TaxID=1667239 RepID=A0A5C7FG78_9BACI|nr:alpha/beta hydrolase [Alkalicoccus halolimnae]TXF85274.1 alpha/beta hydrolase [Alkalicoccus halolimnae]